MEADRLGQAAELEKQCFPDPWSENMLREHRENPACVLFAALDGAGALLGYAGAYRVLDEGNITNVAVSPTCRRQGVGLALLRGLEEWARGERLAFLTLEVRISNLTARRLYEKMGFSGQGLRRGYYLKPREDAVIMTKYF